MSAPGPDRHQEGQDSLGQSTGGCVFGAVKTALARLSNPEMRRAVIDSLRSRT
jgi:hypothetical protein